MPLLNDLVNTPVPNATPEIIGFIREGLEKLADIYQQNGQADKADGYRQMLQQLPTIKD